MPAIVELVPDTLGKLLGYIETFQNSREVSWYRGVGDSTHSLLPSLARSQPIKSPEELRRLEKTIANTFSQRSPPFVTIDLSNEWRALFYMQHYGIPTRLLDWSESPFVALYFALSSVKRDDNGVPVSDPALWLCDPVIWNRTSLSHITYDGGVLDENCEEIKAYAPSTDLDQRAMTPIMIYGTHNSPRIVAQRGVFALFGKGLETMQQIYIAGAFAKRSLLKIRITRDKVDEMLISLYRKGVAESTIYPDIAGLALEIRRRFGFH